ncbi:hypothetical protein BLI708_02840 [Bifidobacterium imperatoris]|uniref:Uncharacterized protein n=1 Tax=Bifidobacterium imperatoris TaxID=2020965 RepID=A0ABX7S3I3_9BIFI|nr:hypothetical protein [Bifidobacterium imperatoris]QSY58256.1 hypothetical protein BLI708_02840 [Bifidobacterium imperatoris]
MRQASKQNATDGIFPYTKLEKKIKGRKDIHSAAQITTIVEGLNIISVSLINVASAMAAVTALKSLMAFQLENPNNDPKPE